MHKSFAVTHPEYGVFVGAALGLAFWSKLDAVGQDRAAVFETAEEAREFFSNIPEDVKNFSFVELETSEEFFATIKELEDGGLGNLLGHLGSGERVVGMEIDEAPAEYSPGM